MLRMIQRLLLSLLLLSVTLKVAAAVSASNALVGQSATFTASCYGTAPFTYQWYKGGVAISGATSATYTINKLSLADSGDYTVSISNSIGAAKSGDYALNVSSLPVAPSIATQPQAIKAVIGDYAFFTVKATGTATLYYQWKKNGVDIVGATDANLIFNSVTAGDAATYSVTVSNSAGSITSQSATLTTLTPPSISAQPASLSLQSGQAASFSVTASGTGPLAYQWLKDGSAISGASGSTYALATVSAADAGSYAVEVSNEAGCIRSSSATLTVTAAVIQTVVAPSIGTQPASLSLKTGQSASFSVSAAGSGPLSYQWYKDATAITGATASTYSIAAVSTTDAAAYSVKVSNSAGSVTSSAATLSVAAPVLAPSISSQPGNLTVNAGQAATFSVSASGTAPFTYQWYKGTVALTGANSASYQIASASSSDAGTYSVKITNSAGSITSASATLTVSAVVTISAPLIIIQPVSTSAQATKPASFSVSASGTAPFSFQWYKDGVALAGGTNSSYSLGACALSDAGNYQVLVSNAAGTASSNVVSLSVSAASVAPSITSQPVALVVAPAQPANFSVTASGTAPFTYQWYKNSVPITGATKASYSIAACTTSDAGTYSVTVFNAIGSATSKGASLLIDSTLQKPAIAAQPVAVTVALGQPASFAVKATGSATLIYQWRKNGEPISGANTDSFAIPQTVLGDEGSYSVLVSNGAGSVLSAAASLSVTQPVSNGILSRITNMSVRSICDSAKGPMIIGFNVDGGAKDMLIRATGPALGLFGVTGTLADPTLTLYSGSAEMANNDNWSDGGLSSTLSACFDKVGAFALSDSNSKDAAMLATVDGTRTVHVKSAQSGASGVVLLEVYDLGSGTSRRLTNLSIMNYSGSGAQSLIVGFTIEGSGKKRVLIRGVGPGLSPFGVTGVLADPTLELHGSVNGADTILAQNDNWQDTPAAATAFSTAGAFGLPDGSKDTALVIELPAGAYTAMVSGSNGNTGTALVEVYELP